MAKFLNERVELQTGLQDVASAYYELQSEFQDFQFGLRHPWFYSTMKQMYEDQKQPPRVRHALGEVLSSPALIDVMTCTEAPDDFKSHLLMQSYWNYIGLGEPDKSYAQWKNCVQAFNAEFGYPQPKCTAPGNTNMLVRFFQATSNMKDYLDEFKNRILTPFKFPW